MRRRLILLVLSVCFSCSKDDGGCGASSSGNEHSCVPSDTSTFICQDMHMETEVAASLCAAEEGSTFVSGKVCDIPAGQRDVSSF